MSVKSIRTAGINKRRNKKKKKKCTHNLKNYESRKRILFVYILYEEYSHIYIIQYIFKYESEYKFNKYPGSSGKYMRNNYS